MATGRATRDGRGTTRGTRRAGTAVLAALLVLAATTDARGEEPPAPAPAAAPVAAPETPPVTIPATAPAATPAPAPTTPVPATTPTASPEPGTPSGTIDLPAATAPSGTPGTPTDSLITPTGTAEAPAPAPGTTPPATTAAPAPASTETVPGTAVPAPGTAAASGTTGGLTNQLGTFFKTDKLKIDGYWWLHYNKVSSFALDEKGNRDGVNQYLDHRLRIRPRLMLSAAVDVQANLDVLAGQLWGDTSKAAADEQLEPRSNNSFTGQSALRELFIEWRSKGGVLRAGQIASRWGLGLVANDGEDREDNFSDTRYGDRTERVQFTMAPATWGTDAEWAKGLKVSLAGDLVFRDDNADLVAGDRAWQFVGATWWDGAVIPGTWDMFTGVYVAYRNQKYDDGDRLEATVVDVFTRHVLPLGTKGIRLILSAEGAVTTGHTDAVRFERAKTGVDVLQWAMAFRADLDVPQYHLLPSIELGVASGDKDGRDGTARAFTFDPDYQAGMILFRQVLGRMSAWAVSRASDPALADVPAKGYEKALTNGAITNALYLYPRLKWSPMKGLDIRLAFLWARALADVVDPYGASVYNGGYPRSYRNGAPSKDLGWEIDGGISYKTPNFWGPFFVRLGAQFGWCKPGAAFADDKGTGLGGIWEARVMADLGF